MIECMERCGKNYFHSVWVYPFSPQCSTYMSTLVHNVYYVLMKYNLHYRYGMIHFPRGTLDQDGWTNVIQGLANEKIRVREVLYVPWDNITDEQRRQLSHSTKTMLGGMLVG